MYMLFLANKHILEANLLLQMHQTDLLNFFYFSSITSNVKSVIFFDLLVLR